MVKIVVETYGEDVLKKLYSELYDKEDWAEECELCLMPTLLHRDADGKRIGGSCTRRNEPTEVLKSWSLFKKKMKPIRDWYRDDMDKKQANNGFMEVMKSNQEVMAVVAEALKKGNTGTTNKLVKPAKVPSWCKGMKIQAYKKSLEVWMENNKDMPDAAKYQDIIESLKMNKDIEGLAKYI